MSGGLVEFVLRYRSRVRRAWRALLSDAEDVSEHVVEPDTYVARKSKPTRDDYARQAVAPGDGMVKSAESDVNDVLVTSGRHNPIREGDLRIESVNDFGALIGGRQIFFR
jgi:hypothetical protein